MIKIGVVGTGSWGTTLAFLISQNIQNNDKYDAKVLLWGVEEMYDNRKLSDIINEKKDNEKYLPGVYLGHNIYCTSDHSGLNDVDVLVVALPHQYIDTMTKFKSHIKEDCVLLSVVKGFIEKENTFVLVSEYLKKVFNRYVNVLMGANIAMDVARGASGDMLYKCEGTLGYKNEKDKDILFAILNCKAYKVTCVQDVKGVELCGALKNIVALGYGVLKGLECSGNTKVAFLRRGLLEIKSFAELFYGHKKPETFFESCGLADLIVSCQSGRNCKYGIEKAKLNLPTEEFEARINNQKIQGVGTCMCVYKFLAIQGMRECFPIFTAVYHVFCEDCEAKVLLECF